MPMTPSGYYPPTLHSSLASGNIGRWPQYSCSVAGQWSGELNFLPICGQRYHSTILRACFVPNTSRSNTVGRHMILGFTIAGLVYAACFPIWLSLGSSVKGEGAFDMYRSVTTGAHIYRWSPREMMTVANIVLVVSSLEFFFSGDYWEPLVIGISLKGLVGFFTPVCRST